MKKGIKFTGAAVILSLFIVLSSVIQAKAEETAAFKVQASEVQSDGTIKVSVYLAEISDMGGIEAELVCEPDKLTYVSSGLGIGFLDGYGTTHYDAETSSIKCVAIFKNAKNTQGEIMHAVFRPNNVESWQPEFRIVNLVDSSVELNSIPYTISYQQAAGNWTDSQDKSGQKADSNVIQSAKDLYASEADWEGFSSGYPKDETADDLQVQATGDTPSDDAQENVEDSTVEDMQGSALENESEGEKVVEKAVGNSKEEKQQKGKQEKEQNSNMVIIVGILIIAVFIIGCVFIRRKRNEK